MNGDDKNSRYILQSVDKALTIIDVLCQHETLSAQEVAKLARIGKSSAFRLLTTLENRGYIRKDSNTKYSLGVKFYSIRMLLNTRDDLTTILHPYLVELNRQTGETCHLSTLNNNSELLFLDHVAGTSQVRVGSVVGQTRSLYNTSAGKAILAFQRRPFVRNYAENLIFESSTPNTIMNVASLYSELERIRADGFACDNEELEVGLTCFGAAILNSQNEAVAAFCISGPTSRMLQNKEPFVKALKSAAEKASRALQISIA